MYVRRCQSFALAGFLARTDEVIVAVFLVSNVSVCTSRLTLLDVPPIVDAQCCLSSRHTTLTAKYPPPPLCTPPSLPPLPRPPACTHTNTHTHACMHPNTPTSGRAGRPGDQILPGMALQSDQLATAVDNARRLLQLPRGRPGGDAGEGDQNDPSPGQQQQGRPPPTASKRASERLLLRFAARGGGGQRTGVTASRSGKGRKSLRLLSLGADLGGSWAKVDPSPSSKGFQRR